MIINGLEGLEELRKKMESEGKHQIDEEQKDDRADLNQRNIEKKAHREAIKKAKQEAKTNIAQNSNSNNNKHHLDLHLTNDYNEDSFVLGRTNEATLKKIIESGRPIKSILSELSIFVNFKKKLLEDPLIKATDTVRKKFRDLYAERELLTSKIQRNERKIEEYKYTIKNESIRRNLIDPIEREINKLRSELSSLDKTIKKRLYDLEIDIEMERDRIVRNIEKTKKIKEQERWISILKIAKDNEIPSRNDLDIDAYEKYVHQEVERKDIISHANEYNIDLTNYKSLSNKDLELFVRDEIAKYKLKNFASYNNLEIPENCDSIEELEYAIHEDIELKLSLLHTLMIKTKDNFEEIKKDFDYVLDLPEFQIPEVVYPKIKKNSTKFNIGIYKTPEELFKSLESIESDYYSHLNTFLDAARHNENEGIAQLNSILESINSCFKKWHEEYPYYKFISLEEFTLGISELPNSVFISSTSLNQGVNAYYSIYGYKLAKDPFSNVVTMLTTDEDDTKANRIPSYWESCGISYGTQIDDIAIILYNNLFDVDEIEINDNQAIIKAHSLDNNVSFLFTFRKVEITDPLKVSLGYMLHSIKCNVQQNELSKIKNTIKAEIEKRKKCLDSNINNLKSVYLGTNTLLYDFDALLLQSKLKYYKIAGLKSLLLIESQAEKLAKKHGNKNIERIIHDRISIIKHIIKEKEEKIQKEVEKARIAQINEMVKCISSNNDMAFAVAENFVELMKQNKCFEYKYLSLLINHMGVDAKRTFFDKYLLKDITVLLLKDGEFVCRQKEFITNFVDLLYKYYSKAWKMTIPMDLVYSLSDIFPDFKQRDLPVRTLKTVKLDWSWVKFGNGIVTIEQPKNQFDIQFESKSFTANWLKPELGKIAIMNKTILMPIICTVINRQLNIDKEQFNNILIQILTTYNKIEKEIIERNERALRDIRRSEVSYSDFLGMKSDCMKHLRSIQDDNYSIYKCDEKTSVPYGRKYDIEVGYLFTTMSYLSDGIVTLIYENKNMDRATYVFKVDSRNYGLAVKSIIDYFESEGSRKRKDLQEELISPSSIYVLDYAQVIHLNYDYDEWLNILNSKMW